jgi:hypothetical protein
MFDEDGAISPFFEYSSLTHKVHSWNTYQCRHESDPTYAATDLHAGPAHDSTKQSSFSCDQMKRTGFTSKKITQIRLTNLDLPLNCNALASTVLINISPIN